MRHEAHRMLQKGKDNEQCEQFRRTTFQHVRKQPRFQPRIAMAYRHTGQVKHRHSSCEDSTTSFQGLIGLRQLRADLQMLCASSGQGFADCAVSTASILQELKNPWRRSMVKQSVLSECRLCASCHCSHITVASYLKFLFITQTASY